MLTSKQRAHLRALANSIDTILHVGKEGLSPNLERQADDALSARELVKGCVLETSPLAAREACRALAETLRAEPVQVIGRRFVLYRKNQKEPKIVLP